MTNNKQIGVIATPATISSNLYPEHLKKLNPETQSISKACPLFVPLAEEALTSGDVTETIVKHYLTSFKSTQIDTMILGCTHYPLLRETIQQFLGGHIYLVDSGKAAAIYLREVLKNNDLLNEKQTIGHLNVFLSCVTPNFEKIVELCLKHKHQKLELVDIETIEIHPK